MKKGNTDQDADARVPALIPHPASVGSVRPMDAPALSVRQDAITPEYFITHFYEYLPRYIAGGAPTEDTRDTYELAIRLFLRW